MTKNLKPLACIIFLSLVPSMTFANALLVGLNVTAGGDTTARFSDGTKQQAGDGGGFNIGYEFDVGEENLYVIKATVGKSSDDPDLRNGRTKLEQTRYNLVLMKRLGNHQFGGGFAYHSNQSWNFTGPVIGTSTVDYQSAWGLAAQYGWQFSQYGELGARYTSIEYEPEITGASTDASSFGIFVNFKLPH